MDWSLDLVEDKYRWPAMVMNWLFIGVVKRNFEDAQPFVFEEDFVMLRRSNDGIKSRIPGGWIAMVRNDVSHYVFPIDLSVDGDNLVLELFQWIVD
jgi:hypothetical protein